MCLMPQCFLREGVRTMTMDRKRVQQYCTEIFAFCLSGIPSAKLVPPSTTPRPVLDFETAAGYFERNHRLIDDIAVNCPNPSISEDTFRSRYTSQVVSEYLSFIKTPGALPKEYGEPPELQKPQSSPPPPPNT